MLSESAVEMQKDVYVCFIDYEKAFNNVRREQLFQDLEELGLDTKDSRLLSELYWKQSAASVVKINMDFVQKAGIRL